MTFTLRRPSSEDPHLRSEAEVLSRHHSLAAAQRASLRYRQWIERQGFCREAFIWNDDQSCLVIPERDPHSRKREGDRHG